MNETGAKLSIGIPIYNGAAFLPQLLECLYQQTFTDFEAIISDNASTDASEEICRAAAASDPRFRYFRNPDNIGAAPNFNRVFELGSGRYFKWTAHDDLLAPTYLERCVAVLDDDPTVSVCHTAIHFVDAERRPLHYDPAQGVYLNDRREPVVRREPAGLAASPDRATRFDDVLHRMRLCTEVFGVMRSDLLRRTSLHGSYYGSDKVLLAELALLGRFESVAEPLFIKRCHGDMSATLNTRQRAKWIDPAAPYRVPQIQVLKGYLASLSLVPLTPTERIRCLRSIARKVFNAGTMRRLLLPGPANYLGIEARSGIRRPD